MIDQIKATIEADSTISAIVGTRVYQEAPIETQSDAYIELRSAINFRSMVDQEYALQIISFSDDLDELDNINNALIDLFENKQTVGTDYYYKIYFINQGTKTRLKNGFYFCINNFAFKKTT